MRLLQANTVGAAQTAIRERQRQPQGGGRARKHWGAAYDDSSAEWDPLAVLETPQEQSSVGAAREFRAPFSSGTEREAFSMSMDEISLRL